MYLCQLCFLHALCNDVIHRCASFASHSFHVMRWMRILAQADYIMVWGNFGGVKLWCSRLLLKSKFWVWKIKLLKLSVVGEINWKLYLLFITKVFYLLSNFTLFALCYKFALCNKFWKLVKYTSGEVLYHRHTDIAASRGLRKGGILRKRISHWGNHS